jgi:hypothetical protein
MKVTRISFLILSLILSAVVAQGHGQGSTQTTREPTAAAEKQTKEAFYCGVTTKAGTPCKHRVKARGAHGWQHQGGAKK